MAKTYLSDRILSMKESGIRKFFQIAATMKDVISLGIGEPDFDSPPAITQAGLDALNNQQTHYTSNRGLLPLRQAISDHLAERYDVRYDPVEEIGITVGGSEAYFTVDFSRRVSTHHLPTPSIFAETNRFGRLLLLPIRSG